MQIQWHKHSRATYCTRALPTPSSDFYTPKTQRFIGYSQFPHPLLNRGSMHLSISGRNSSATRKSSLCVKKNKNKTSSFSQGSSKNNNNNFQNFLKQECLRLARESVKLGQKSQFFEMSMNSQSKRAVSRRNPRCSRMLCRLALDQSSILQSSFMKYRK